MARYRGPRIKVCRALGTILPGMTTESALQRPFRPGQHGGNRAGKASDYKERLMEKQKLRFHFGILEKKFKRYVSEATRQKGATGSNLIRLLESRLDNVVWRLGLAATIPAARQLVVHGHILVNGSRVDRPSYHVSVNTEITIKKKTLSKSFMQDALENSASRVRPPYLTFDVAEAKGVMTTQPNREDLPFEIDLQKIIEFYSQQL